MLVKWRCVVFYACSGLLYSLCGEGAIFSLLKTAVPGCHIVSLAWYSERLVKKKKNTTNIQLQCFPFPTPPIPKQTDSSIYKLISMLIYDVCKEWTSWISISESGISSDYLAVEQSGNRADFWVLYTIQPKFEINLHFISYTSFIYV